MSAPAATVPRRADRAGATARRARGTVPAVAVAVALVGWAASSSHFTWDDFPNFAHALERGLTWDYLLRPATTLEFPAPAHRLANWLLQTLAPLRFDVALAVLLSCLAAAVVLLHRVLVELARPAWWTAVLAGAAGTSVVTVTAAQWWTAGLHSLPSTALSLAAVLAWLRWRRGGRRALLAVAVAAIALGSLFYVKAALVPLYLVLLRLLALERLPVRRWVPALVAERGEWAVLAVPPLAWLAGFVTLGYGGPGAVPDPGALAAYAGHAWARGLLPALVNLRVTAAGAGPAVEAGVVAVQVAFWALVAATVRRDRSAWRGWAFLAVALLANLAVHARYRLAQVGPEILAHELRYYVEAGWLTAIAVAVALAPPGSRRRAAASPSPRAAAGLAAALAAWIALFAWSAAGSAAAWPGTRARAWTTTVVAEVARVRAGGAVPAVLDRVVPEHVVPSWMGPYAHASRVVRTAAPDLRVNRSSGPLWVVGDDGSLAPAEVRPVADLAAADIPPADLTLDGLTRAGGGLLCLAAGPADGTLTYRPAQALAGQRLVVRTRVRAATVDLALAVDRGVGWLATPDATLTAVTADGDALTDLVTATVTGLRLTVPAGTTACVDSLEILDVRTP